VLVVAREFPNSTSINYTSPWAGAHYRPIAGLSAQLIREAKQARRTYNVFRQIAADEPAAGVKFMEGIEYFESPSPKLLEAFGRSDSAYAHLDGLREIPPEELPEDIQWGVRYWTYSLNPPVYCAYLLRKFVLRGGETKEYALASPMEAFEIASNVRTVVNCSGIGFSDPKSFIIRGEHCPSQPSHSLHHRLRNRYSADTQAQVRLVSFVTCAGQQLQGKMPMAHGHFVSLARLMAVPSSVGLNSLTTGTLARSQRSGPSCSKTHPNGSLLRRRAGASLT
jgi:FAD dependent oxidoreductase